MTASAFRAQWPVSDIALDRFQAGHAGSIPVARSDRSGSSAVSAETLSARLVRVSRRYSAG